MTVISRKVYEPGGFAYLFTGGKCKPLPSNVARLISKAHGQFELVTWADVMAERRKRQQARLERIRAVNEEPTICACYVWTFFNPQMIPYHGWYCYVRTLHFEVAVNFRGIKDDLAKSIMMAVPLGLLPMIENFKEWMSRFAHSYPRAKHQRDKRKAGSLVGWITDRRIFTLERPN